MFPITPGTTGAVPAATASAAALALAGCGGTAQSAAGSSGGDGPTVVAGFYPLEWAAQRVGGDRVDVSSLTPPGAEAHDLELAPQDVAAVSEADLLVYLEGFQPALDEGATTEAADTAWDAGRAADLTLTAEEHAHEGETAEEHAAHAEEEGEEEGEA